MEGFGLATPTLLGALAGLLVAAIPALWMWGFTVDDALIPVRYARHLAAGEGYRFNALGPMTDGVTPLPWAFLLAPLARAPATALDVLMRAKCMGLAAWLLAAAAWGAAVARADAPRAAKAAAFASLAACVPVAAHAVSGMETALAMALATAAAISVKRPLRAALFAGLAASLRPEMAPWAVALAAWLGEGPRGKAKSALLAAAPFAICVLARVAWFGRAAPLAVLAKPSDLEHGAVYALAAALVVGAPLLAFAPRALARGPRAGRALALAGALHLAVVVAVGGDWMPYARLVAPIAPPLLYAAVLASRHARTWSLAARSALALGVEVYIVVVAAPAGRHVMRDRAALIEAARAPLQNARIVAALDIGWVSAATEATIVDLAGLTDPTIAVLPGGHTSKRVDPPFLLAREPDVLVVYDPPRAVEARLVGAELIEERYAVTTTLPLAGHEYRLYTRR